MKKNIFGKHTKNIVYAMLCLCTLITSMIIPIEATETNTSNETSTASELSTVQTGEISTQQLVESMQPGWNLGNTFESTGAETSWGNPETTQAMIHSIAAQGYKSIRIPITWNHRVSPDTNATIDEAFLDRIQDIVDWSLDEKLIVMINLHHDSDWVKNIQTDHEGVMNRYTKIWTQISKRFRDYPMELLFESINEPRFSEDWSLDSPQFFTDLDELNRTFVELVRSSGGNNAKRSLVLPTLTCSGSQSRLDALAKTIESLNDPNLIGTIHYYGYWPFSVNISGATTFDDVVKQDIIDTFDRAKLTLSNKGIPVIVGEYGLLGFDRSLDTISHGEFLKYFEFMNYYSQKSGFPLMLWDNGQHFDRINGVFKDDSLYQMMKHYTERSAYTSSDLLFVEATEPLADKSLGLILNGQQLESIESSQGMLIEGEDYEITSESLLFKAAFLQNYMETDIYGERDQLICRFTGGSDWRIHLIQWQKPVLKDMSGKVGAFAIPVKFNGDQLATLEVQYADGTNTEPDSWTSFKAFGVSFVPNYKYNLIELKQDFLQNLKDGDLVIKLHFRSGTLLEYNLTKVGKEVTGTNPDKVQDETNSEIVQESENVDESEDIAASEDKTTAEGTTSDNSNEENGTIENGTTENGTTENKSLPNQIIIIFVVVLIGLLTITLFGVIILRGKKKDTEK